MPTRGRDGGYVPDPVTGALKPRPSPGTTGTRTLGTGTDVRARAARPRPRPQRSRRSDAFFTAPPLAGAVADVPLPKPPVDEARRRVDAELAVRLAANSDPRPSGRPPVQPHAVERPDAAKLRRAKESRRRAKLDAVQDGWRSLLDEGSPAPNGSGSALGRLEPFVPEPTPGPGSYAAPSAFDGNERRARAASARLGRTGRVAASTRPSAFAAEDTPGPGAYGDARGAFDPPPKKGATRGATRGAAFTAAPRFAEDDLDSPGPGRYDPTATTTVAAAKDVPGERANFGTSGARFREPGTAPPNASGVRAPADTRPSSPPPSSPPRRREVPARAGGGFVHGNPRGARKPDPRTRTATRADVHETPAPGAYDAPDLWRAAPHRRGAGGLLSDDPRLDPNPPRRAPGDADPNASPGPGDYDVARRGRDAIPKGRSSLRSGSARMATRTSAAPGPGRYDGIHPHNRMLRRSFNVTVDGAFEPPR